MRGYEVPTLDCQDCGEVVRRLSMTEQQRVADRPYDFVVLCGTCRRNAQPDPMYRLDA